MTVEDHGAALEMIDNELASGRLEGATGLVATLVQGRVIHLAQLGLLDEPARADLSGDIMAPAVSAALGRWDDALERAAQIVEVCRPSLNKFNGGFFEWRIADLMLRRGEVRDAIESLGAAVDSGFGSSAVPAVYSLSSLVQALAEIGDRGEATRRANDLVEAASAIDDLRGTEARVATALGAAAPNDDEAGTHFTRAIEVARRYRLPFQEVDALAAWATRSGSSEHLDTAAAVFERIGAGGDWLVWLHDLVFRARSGGPEAPKRA